MKQRFRYVLADRVCPECFGRCGQHRKSCSRYGGAEHIREIIKRFPRLAGTPSILSEKTPASCLDGHQINV